MKVLLVNGSPHPQGCTYTALLEVEKTLLEDGIETEIIWLGKQAINGCIDCRDCAQNKQCIFNDVVNEFVDKAQSADGFIFGSPVHYAGASGAITAFLDRVFFSTMLSGKSSTFKHKPGSVIVSARRGGTTAAYDQLNKYLGISQMPIISSQYWNMVHGSTPEQVQQDEEGMQIMRVLGRNMAYFLKCQEAGTKAGIQPPASEKRVSTNFIR